jgi:hypothetical protein
MKTKPEIVAEFPKMLDDALATTTKATEQTFQDYLEENTTLFRPPFELNHSVHLSAVISKFKLDTSLTTDFAYLTKSSATWWLVLVELEHPNKPLFKKTPVPTAQLTAAIAQVDSWRTFVEKNPAILAQKIAPLKKPLTQNKLKVKYALVIGRTNEFAAAQAKLDALDNLQRDDFKVLTYDSLFHAFEHKANPVLDVLKQKEQKFTFKHHHRNETAIFGWLSPNEIHLESADIDYYKGEGYDMDSWLQGKLLVVNHRKTEDKFASEVEKALRTGHAPTAD